MTVGVNHFGHFLLTLLLLPLLKKSQPSRIVVVSSSGYKYGILEHFLWSGQKAPSECTRIEDLVPPEFYSQKLYSSFGEYCDSKLANVLFTKELTRKLTAEGAHVTVNAVHPGFVRSEITRDGPWYFQPIFHLGNGIMFMVHSC